MTTLTRNWYFCFRNTQSMREIHYVSTALLDLPTVKSIIELDKKLELSNEAVLNINKSRDYLVKKIKDNEIPIYGINTGFGSLCNVKISADNLSKLTSKLSSEINK